MKERKTRQAYVGQQQSSHNGLVLAHFGSTHSTDTLLRSTLGVCSGLQAGRNRIWQMARLTAWFASAASTSCEHTSTLCSDGIDVMMMMIGSRCVSYTLRLCAGSNRWRVHREYQEQSGRQVEESGDLGQAHGHRPHLPQWYIGALVCSIHHYRHRAGSLRHCYIYHYMACFKSSLDKLPFVFPVLSFRSSPHNTSKLMLDTFGQVAAHWCTPSR